LCTGGAPSQKERECKLRMSGGSHPLTKGRKSKDRKKKGKKRVESNFIEKGKEGCEANVM